MSGSPVAVQDLLEGERQRIDDWLARVAREDVPPGPLAAPMRYALEGGGKRLRGALCVLAYRALGGRDERGIDDVACALELVHAYSLVHDDLPCMDDDDLRRGRPTLHRVFGPRAAMLAGAALVPLAFRILARGAGVLQLGRAEARALVGLLARGAGAAGMVGGQWQDLEAEHRAVDLERLLRIHAAKTGALFQATLGAGALAAGAAAARVEACMAFGAELGLAFQVVDDILDETADTAVLGKTAGKDRQQEKATYPALLGLDGARARAREAVRRGAARLRSAGIGSMELESVGQWLLERDH